MPRQPCAERLHAHNAGAPEPTTEQPAPGQAAEHDSVMERAKRSPAVAIAIVPDRIPQPPAASAFRSGLGTVMQVTAKAQAHARKLLAYEDTTEPGSAALQPPAQDPVVDRHDATGTTSLPAFTGLKWGTGKPAEPSDKAQAKAAAMFQAEGLQGDAVSIAGLQKSSGHDAPVMQPLPAACAFQWGTGQAAKPSEKAQAKAAAMFQAEGWQADAASIAGPQTSSGHDTHVTQPPPAACAFQWGTGQAAKPSDKAQAKAAAMFQAEGWQADAVSIAGPQTSSGHDTPVMQPLPAACAFQWGTGQAAKPSDKAQAKAAAMFQAEGWQADAVSIAGPQTNSGHDTPVMQPPPASCAFQWGTGQAAKLTAKGQAKAANMFEDNDAVVKPMVTEAELQPADRPQSGNSNSHRSSSPVEAPVAVPAASGFMSGTGKAVLVTAKGQHRAQNMFQDQNTASQALQASQTAAANRPDMKAKGVTLVLGTPKSAPPAGKTALKRLAPTSRGSSGGKVFKKPRRGKFMTPSCLGGTPNRVRSSSLNSLLWVYPHGHHSILDLCLQLLCKLWQQ